MPPASQFTTPSVKALPELSETLKALPEALCTNVLAYAARKVRELGVAFHQAGTTKIPKEIDKLVDALKDMAAAEDAVAATATEAPGVVMSLNQRMRELVTELSRFSTFNTASMVVNDPPLLTLLNDAQKHFGDTLSPQRLETITNEALEHVLHLQETDRAAFRRLSRIEILPVVKEMAAEASQIASYGRLAFAAVAGVAFGVAIKERLFPHKDPHQQPQLA